MDAISLILSLISHAFQEVEVRAGGNGVKAKWIRIELRKVETLPGGGLTNTFFDFVGNSPVLLWQSGQEYSPMTRVRTASYCARPLSPHLPPTFIARLSFSHSYPRGDPSKYLS